MSSACRFIRLVWPFALVATRAAFASEATITRIADPADAPWTATSNANLSGCMLGIDGPVAEGAVNFFPLEYEEFRLVVDPGSGCSTCSDGFHIASIHIAMQVSEPCTLTMSANLGAVDLSRNPDCPRPGAVLCQGPVQTVVLPGSGTWDIGLPVDCTCRDARQKYTLGIQVFELSCWPILMTDGTPTTCRNWDNIGWGWVDLPVSDTEWPGDLIFYAEGTCCSVTAAPGPATPSPRTLLVFPNPTPGRALVSFTLDAAASVDLAVYDVTGRRVATLHRGALGRGTFEFPWSATDTRAHRVPAGTYFVRLDEGRRASTAKLVLNR